ncbi:IclR family transcriptional regulator [Rhizobium sp. TRM95111]|uniref:IclR family transcriptional regulator n=1 Tax=Rhizobium alarense TaxID=2846851 RepID=UPI001F3B2AC5|nr:IclR family transcriptional regulator [Rhizobium alarense]MCF3642269.1 IclR family transcriptional regulator [Rhizobium alarense]
MTEEGTNSPRPETAGDVAIDTGTLGKMMALLDIVAGSETAPRFTDILRRSRQPRGTLHRQLGHLVAEGLLAMRSDHSYELGIRLLKFASDSWARSEFRIVAEPHLKALHAATGETVHLALLRDAEIIYLDKVESRQAVRMSSQIGKASPAYCTGVGKACLSALSDEQLKALLKTMRFQRFTENTLGGPEALLSEVAEIRRTGHAFDREEHEVGIRCVAAPIGAADGGLVAGISVTGPAYRVEQPRLEAWAPLVRAAAGAIMTDMAIRFGPQRGVEP